MTATQTVNAPVVWAAGLAELTLWLGIGSGGSWTSNPPNESVSSTGLTAPLAYLRAIRLSHVTDSEQANTPSLTTIDSQRWWLAPDPTGNLLCAFTLSTNDLAGETIREVGLFQGLTLNTGVTTGQLFYPASDVASPGNLFVLDNRPAFDKTDASGISIEFLVRPS